MSAIDSDCRKVLRYSRDQGALCFEMSLLGRDRSPADFVAQLLASDLRWLWSSETRASCPDQRTAVVTRSLTQLTELTALDLIADFSERDEDGYGRFVSLFGVRNLPQPFSPSWLHEELGKLAVEQGGDLEIVVVQLGDSFNEYIYVRRTLSNVVVNLLNEWKIRATSLFKEKSYGSLRAITLESLFDLNATPE